MNIGAEIRVVLIGLALVLAGCTSNGMTVREGIGGGATAVKVLATASAAKFAECVNDTEAGSADERMCLAEKNDRGRDLMLMAEAFDAAAMALADGSHDAACENLLWVREIAAALRGGLEAYMPSPHLATVELLIQSTIPECEV